MEPKTQKYLIIGGVVLVAIIAVITLLVYVGGGDPATPAQAAVAMAAVTAVGASIARDESLKKIEDDKAEALALAAKQKADVEDAQRKMDAVVTAVPAESRDQKVKDGEALFGGKPPVTQEPS